MAKNPDVRDWTRTRKYRELERDLMDNLSARGLVDRVYTDKAEEYLSLWCIRQELQADVEMRGVSLWSEKYGAYIENRSVSLIRQVSAQMLAIYIALGFKEQPGAGRGAPPEDEL